MTMERVHCREEGMTTEKGHQLRGDDNEEGTVQGKGHDNGEGTSGERGWQ